MLLYALDYFPPSVVEPVTQLGVFIAIALGGLWFGERVRARWLPAALVVCGAALVLFGGRFIVSAAAHLWRLAGGP